MKKYQKVENLLSFCQNNAIIQMQSVAALRRRQTTICSDRNAYRKQRDVSVRRRGQGNRYLYFATGYPVCAADSIDAAPVGPYRRACQPAWRGSADGADLPPLTFNSIFKICSMQKAAILQR